MLPFFSHNVSGPAEADDVREVWAAGELVSQKTSKARFSVRGSAELQVAFRNLIGSLESARAADRICWRAQVEGYQEAPSSLLVV